MKKLIYLLILPLLVAGGLVFASRAIKHETIKKVPERPFTEAEKREGMRQWLATPQGIKFKEWEESPEGKKVYASIAKIDKHNGDSAGMEAVVTSLSLPPGSLLGFGVMARIDGDDYILRFDNDTLPLHSLKVNDKIRIRSRSISLAPKYAYPIVSGESVERGGVVIYRHPPQKGGC